MVEQTRSYLREFGAAMVAYVVVLALSLVVIINHPTAPWRFAVAVLPMLPALGMVWAIVRAMQRMDELQRRMQTEALAFGFGGTAVLTFSYGFLENVGFPHLNWFFIWPLMALLWSVGAAR